MKKVLVIAYFFPPLGGSGVQRTLKFVKYLPESGILPVVSTVTTGHNFAHDESLLDEVPPEVKVYRSSSLETLWLREVIEKVASLRRGDQAKLADTGEEPQKQGPTQKPEAIEKTEEHSNDLAATQPQKDEIPGLAHTSPVEERPRKSLKQRVFEFIDDYLFIPDSKVRWLPFGFLKSVQVARREQVDYIFSSSYPYTVHLIALLVHKWVHKPWIADFRDPWVGNKAMQKDLPFRKKLDAWMERKVVTNASYILNVTPALTDMYKNRYPEYADKMITITNGFDPADFLEIAKIPQEKFTLIHTGIIAETYDMETFTEGVERFLKRYPEARENFQALFIGYVPTHYEERMKNRLEGTAVFKPYMKHKDVLNYLAGAQLQFMTFDRSVDIAFSGKLFDYIGIGKPILGLLPEGIAAKLIRERGLGKVVSLEDPEGLSEAISDYYTAWLANDTKTFETGSRERCSEFSRVNLAQQLASLFK
jgi:glycosyltransferase involved in cell wall biosynthesis